MAEERIYTIPLRKEFEKVPGYRKARKAVYSVRNFLIKHMKNNNVKIGRYLNEKILERGRKNPPYKIQVKAWKEKVKLKDKEIEIVKAELVGAPEEKKEEEKKVVKKEESLEKLEKETEKVLEKEEKKEQVLTEKEKEKILLEKEPKKEVKQEKKEEVIKPEVQEAERRKQIIGKTQKPHHEKKK